MQIASSPNNFFWNQRKLSTAFFKKTVGITNNSSKQCLKLLYMNNNDSK